MLKTYVIPYKELSDGHATGGSLVHLLYADGDQAAKSMEGFMSKEPKTKEQFLNRMLMSDFSGDIRDLAADRNITLKRTSANKLELTFQASGQKFELVVRKPRSPEQIAKMLAKKLAKAGAGKSGRGSRKAPAQQPQQQH